MKERIKTTKNAGTKGTAAVLALLMLASLFLGAGCQWPAADADASFPAKYDKVVKDRGNWRTTPENVDIGDEDLVDEALALYNEMSPAFKDALLPERDHLYTLKAAIAVLKAGTSEDLDPDDPVREPFNGYTSYAVTFHLYWKWSDDKNKWEEYKWVGMHSTEGMVTLDPFPAPGEREGFFFRGWYDAGQQGKEVTDRNCKVTNSDFTPLPNDGKDLDFYAYWQAPTYVTVTFTGEATEEIIGLTANPAERISWSNNMPLKVSVNTDEGQWASGSDVHFEWFIDVDDVLKDHDSASIKIKPQPDSDDCDISGLSLGTHWLSVKVTKGTDSYSKTLFFEVED